MVVVCHPRTSSAAVKPPRQPADVFKPEELVKVRLTVPVKSPVLGPKTLVFWGVHSYGDEFLIHRLDYEALTEFMELVEPESSN